MVADPGERDQVSLLAMAALAARAAAVELVDLQSRKAGASGADLEGPDRGLAEVAWCGHGHSPMTSTTAILAAASSTIDLLAAKVATRAWMARLLTCRGKPLEAC